jgi:fused signal recognition particle receptor
VLWKFYGGIKMKLFSNINFEKLKNSLTKTRENLVNKISEKISGKVNLNENELELLEEILLSSDIGFTLTEKLITEIRKKAVIHKDRNFTFIKDLLFEEMMNIFNNGTKEIINSNNKPFVYLIVGVNGAGKTTTLGKLAYNYKKNGNKVMVVAADTFRAAANEQLEVWAKRAEVPIFRSDLKDPSSVVFESLKIAKNDNYDIVLIDTAGRLHTKKNLMDELTKINNAINKVAPHAPTETLLVLDATSGQNVLIQANEFNKFVKIDGLVLTKLDGSAKGGIVLQICSEKKIPIKYIGVGEGHTDLQNFAPDQFIKAMFH